jgi:hypothetical protein
LDGWAPPEAALDRPTAARKIELRRLADDDWKHLPDTFLSAFAGIQPLASWGKFAARRAARCIIDWSRLGRDGPLVRDACFVAVCHDEIDALRGICGASVVTLAPINALWNAPQDAAVPHPEKPDRRVMPHLDWLFVNRWLQRHGIGTRLLNATARALRDCHFHVLASTCMLDNGPALLWHWRNGFRVPSDRTWRELLRGP